MGGDAKRFVGLIVPLAIVYMTYASISATAPPLRQVEAKSLSTNPASTMPKLPSEERELRNPFVPEGHAGAVAAALTGAKSGRGSEQDALRLDGTVIAGSLRFAIINGTRVMEGDYFRGLKLEKVETNQVRLAGGKEETILPLGITKSDASLPVAATASPAQEARKSTAGMGVKPKTDVKTDSVVRVGAGAAGNARR